ncbi:MAG TPA: pyridoxal-phosphate dependent enzyme [Myxococcales bacterium]|nr:pyridoxal-phosphate dependent enzyme [Myxococcales bacterium]
MNAPAAEKLRGEARRLQAAAASLGLPLPTPSPLQLAEGLPAPWSRARLWVKRDDLLGTGGTKVRKLAHALAAAKAAGAQTVLTFGHLDSNHALATARAARAAGLRTELWLQERSADELPERRRAMAEAAERVTYRRGTVGLVLGAAGSFAAAAVRGRPPWVMLPGGTSPATSAAVAPLVLEVVEQLAVLGEPLPPRWAVAVGSGGTLAGLWAGVRGLGLPVRLVAFHASDPWLTRRSLVAALANAALDRLDLPGHVGADEIELSAAQFGPGHGVPTEASRRAREEWAAAGLPLDPTYGAKAAAGLREAIERGPEGDRWLFVSTGTQVGP